MFAFEERGKPEFPQKNLSEQAKEETTIFWAHVSVPATVDYVSVAIALS